VNGFAPRVDWTNPSRPCTVTRVHAELLNDQARVETCCEQTWPERNCGSEAWHKVDDVLLTRTVIECFVCFYRNKPSTRSLSPFYGPWCIVFVKLFALCYRPVVLSVLFCPVCLWRWCIVAKWLDDQNETWHGGRPSDYGSSRSVQPFLHGSIVWQTDRQTDRQTTLLGR